MTQPICVLSGLEIPKGKESREHYCCKHRFPQKIWNNKNNIFWAHYMLNAIKSNYLPCEWADMKYDLTYYALTHWRIKDDDRDFLQRAMDNWTIYQPDPCALCLAKCNQKERQ